MSDNVIEGARFGLSAEGERAVGEAVARYPEKTAAMLPVLWIVQREKGWIAPEAMEWVAARVGCSPGAVQAVVGFYTMLDDRPVGRWKLQVCRTLSCELMGARSIVDHLVERLGIEPGQTTEDGVFTLQEVECLGSCGTGPMLQCNFRFHENLTRERIDALLEELRRTEADMGALEPVVHDRPSREAYASMVPRTAERTRATADVGGAA